MRARYLFWLGWASACGFSTPLGPTDAPGGDGPVADVAPDSTPVADAAPDAVPDAPATFCYGTFETVCLAQAPSTPLSVAGGNTTTIDTDDPTACATLATGSTLTDACVLAFTTATIDGTLVAHGTRPLILLGTGTVNVNGGGLIDVASRGAARGAGARTCSGTVPTGGGGGFGGSFGQAGGTGGNNATGTGGVPNPTETLVDLVGGCRGADGGAASASDAGIGGHGGGGVLVIGSSITVDGSINASGAGGTGGVKTDSGGGGGGSGGAIVLDAGAVVLNASGRLFAQGGGGGEGSGNSNTGDAGSDVTAAGTAAAGGAGNSSSGGDGGAGGVSNGGTGGNTASGGGGGGGGGGAGHIRCTDPTPTVGGQAYPALVCA